MSKRSLLNFILINSSVILFTILIFLLQNLINYYSFLIRLFATILLYLFRNIILCNIISIVTKHKEIINKNSICKEDYKGEFLYNVLRSSIIETITYMLIINIFHFTANNFINIILLFIPKSFFFEIIFDFFHYWTHRVMHEKKFLYKNFHKKHHKHIKLEPILTFYQDPIDLLLTNSFPMILSLYIFKLFLNLSLFELSLIIIYKIIIEIAGHSGIISNPTTSFLQFIWLPKLLNMELYTEDHDKHHTLIYCNYSKRFSLWDKIFGTFK